MNELRRSLLKAEIFKLADTRDRLERFRDAEIQSCGEGRIDAINCLSEASQALLVIIGLLERAKKCQ